MKRLPFRVEMARAWHAGLKTVTRRIVKFHKPWDDSRFWPTVYRTNDGGWGFTDAEKPIPQMLERPGLQAPYAPGSTVIIAEPLVAMVNSQNEPIARYAADSVVVSNMGNQNGVLWPWRVNSPSARYMPNWAARSWAKIVSVRVERLQEITEEDAIAEGVRRVREACHVVDGFGYDTAGLCHSHAITAYSLYFESINGPGSWEANPWVFRYELQKLSAEEVSQHDE